MGNNILDSVRYFRELQFPFAPKGLRLKPRVAASATLGTEVRKFQPQRGCVCAARLQAVATALRL
jgi:hypothetical protein